MCVCARARVCVCVCGYNASIICIYKTEAVVYYYTTYRPCVKLSTDICLIVYCGWCTPLKAINV